MWTYQWCWKIQLFFFEIIFFFRIPFTSFEPLTAYSSLLLDMMKLNLKKTKKNQFTFLLYTYEYIFVAFRVMQFSLASFSHGGLCVKRHRSALNYKRKTFCGSYISEWKKGSDKNKYFMGECKIKKKRKGYPITD